MKKLAINTLVWKNISTYRWTLNISEAIYDYEKYELKEYSQLNWTSWYIKLEDEKDLIPINDIEIDYELIEWYEDELDIFDEYFEERIKENIPDLKEKLKKYWLSFNWFSYYKPMYYNFEDDELLLEYEIDDEKIDDELKPYIQNYIDNIRVESYDWYISFEPSKIEDIDKSDYAFLYAILDKENLIEPFKQSIDEAIEDFYESYYEYYYTVYYYERKKYRLSEDDNWYFLKLED